MDIKEKVSEIAEKITKDKTLQAQFQKDPEKAVEKLLGVDIPDGILDKVVSGVKAKVSLDSLSGAAGALKKLF